MVMESRLFLIQGGTMEIFGFKTLFLEIILLSV